MNLQKLSKKPFVYQIMLCAFLLMLFVIISLGQNLIYYIAGINTVTRILGMAGHAMAFVIVIRIGLRDQKRTLASVCFFKHSSAGVWAALVLCSIGFVLFSFYIHFLFFSFIEGWNTDFDLPEDSLLLNTIDQAVIPAVAEELLFKGLIFSFLRKRHSMIMAVIISSMLFAVCHLSIIRIIPLFMVSCFTFWVYLRTGNIILPMFIHFLNNFFTLVLISEPFGNLATFYSALVIFAVGIYLLHTSSKETRME